MTTPVAESTGYGPNRGMSAIGYITGALIFLLLLPFLPFVIVGYLVYRLFRSDDEERRPRSWTRNIGGGPRRS